MTIAADDRPIASSGNLIADRRFGFGRDLASRGDLTAAADLFAQAVEAAPDFAAGWAALGETRAKLGEQAGAVVALREAVRIDPQDRHGAALHLARLGAADPKDAMSPAYVRTLFDQYAPRFDDALEDLAYRGPELLAQAVARIRARSPGASATGTNMLDLGCGTGLAGAAFRRDVGHLTGVDLSPRMIAKARIKNVYDRLETADLVEFLVAERTGGRRYDLVIAADVLVYLFDLAPVMRAAADVLNPAGLLAFTVETYPGDAVELGEKLRYRHGTASVKDAAAAGGLELRELVACASRIEAGAPVPGLLAVATLKP